MISALGRAGARGSALAVPPSLPRPSARQPSALALGRTWRGRLAVVVVALASACRQQRRRTAAPRVDTGALHRGADPTLLLPTAPDAAPAAANNALIRIAIAATAPTTRRPRRGAPSKHLQQARAALCGVVVDSDGAASRCDRRYALRFTWLSGRLSAPRAGRLPMTCVSPRLRAALAVERQANGDAGALAHPAAISISPPCSATSPFTIESPSPVPS